MKKVKSSHWVKVLILLVVSTLLLSLPFLVDHLGFLSLFGLVPLFLIEDICVTHRVRGRGWIYYLFFLLWNGVTTYWIYHATLPGAIAAVVLNSLQMWLVFSLYLLFKKKMYQKVGRDTFLPYLFFIVTWLAWEHFYFDAEISWPWLVLGNAFAGSIKSIQWYEFTGSLGGSLWILLSNVSLYRILKVRERRVKEFIAVCVGYVLLIFVPFIISIAIFNKYQEEYNPKEFVVLQPNIDPYQDKFNTLSRGEQDDILISLAHRGVTPNTKFIVGPETFTWYVDEDNPDASPTIKKIEGFISDYPQTNFIVGAISIKNFYTKNRPTITAKKRGNSWFDTYNASLIVDTSGVKDFFHKSKLVVLVEYIPYPKLLAPINKLAINLGGAMSSYATQPEVTIFTANDGTKVGTAICYESVYGEYYRDYVRKGAQVMTVVTNDGWWSNTPGYKQHLRYSSLRAIETRRSIARSANTGISALINQRGERVAQTQWWVADTLTGNLNLNDKITTFVKYGDIVGRVATGLFLLMLLMYITMVVSHLNKRTTSPRQAIRG